MTYGIKIIYMVNLLILLVKFINYISDRLTSDN